MIVDVYFFVNGISGQDYMFFVFNNGLLLFSYIKHIGISSEDFGKLGH